MIIPTLLVLSMRSDSSHESQILALINEARARSGVSQIQSVRLLREAAQWFARDLAKSNTRLDHVDSLGRRVQHRIYDFGYRSIQRSGENLASGYRDPDSVFKLWMSSSGHRRNLLDPQFEHIGVAFFETQDGRTYWVAEFGQRFKGAPALKP